MSLFTIDQDRCSRDGICVGECPMGLIEAKEEKAFPTEVEGADELCINCGHCVAACPKGAFGLESMKPEVCKEVNKDLLPDPAQVEHFLKTRRSVRCYREKPVPRKILAKLMDIVRFAPSAHNDQPLHWIVVEDKKEVRHLGSLVVDWMREAVKGDMDAEYSAILNRFVKAWDRGEDPILRKAPHVIICHAHSSELLIQENSAIALTYLELAANSLGLGCCWAGALQMGALFSPEITDALNLPEGHQSSGAMMVGYPTHRFYRIPERDESRITWR
jgi:nitroreductase/NAD-dependent dihydropyrimidine dehydrogenase PreA subunit